MSSGVKFAWKKLWSSRYAYCSSKYS